MRVPCNWSSAFFDHAHHRAIVGLCYVLKKSESHGSFDWFFPTRTHNFLGPVFWRAVGVAWESCGWFLFGDQNRDTLLMILIVFDPETRNSHGKFASVFVRGADQGHMNGYLLFSTRRPGTRIEDLHLAFVRRPEQGQTHRQ